MSRRSRKRAYPFLSRSRTNSLTCSRLERRFIINYDIKYRMGWGGQGECCGLNR